MRAGLVALAIALVAFTSISALAEDGGLSNLGGEKRRGEPCLEWAANVWGWSDHNGNGNNNEQNFGFGGRCYVGKRWFLQADYIKNSRGRPTQDVAFGGEFQVLKIENWKLLGAGSLAWVRYERPHKDPVKRWVPVPTIVLRYNDRVDLNLIPVNVLIPGSRVQIFFITWHF